MKRVPKAIAVYVIAAAAVMAGIVLWDRASPPAALNPFDPAVRAKAAAQSITGEPTVRRVEVPASDRVIVHATSKYYSSRAPVQENREYLATEGRLIAQLILEDTPQTMTAVVQLYSGRQRLAVIEAHRDQAYANYAVRYEGALKP